MLKIEPKQNNKIVNKRADHDIILLIIYAWNGAFLYVIAYLPVRLQVSNTDTFILIHILELVLSLAISLLLSIMIFIGLLIKEEEEGDNPCPSYCKK